MSAVHSSVDTVNAAATAIVTAESRVQPSSVQKKKWGSCWNLHGCFGSYKHCKKIGHAVLAPEPGPPTSSAPAPANTIQSNTILIPFIAPPSSPASFLQSDPNSGTHTPTGVVSITSLSSNSYSPPNPVNIFAVGPYANELQLVSPPAFSTYTTEPSTASFTPPPESVQMTTPSSPEVPFAQLLSSSLGRARKNGTFNQKLSLSQYDYQPYQIYHGSPVSNLVSPGSGVSNSGTSSPFPDKVPIIEFRVGEMPKLLGYQYFPPRKWGSRLGSGSLTPDAVEPLSCDSTIIENQILEVASHAKSSESGSHKGEILLDHRVSFELAGEGSADITRKDGVLSIGDISERRESKSGEVAEESRNEMQSKVFSREAEEKHCSREHRSVSLGSMKEFNFDSTKRETLNKPTISSDWWANEKIVGEEFVPDSDWTFFPVLQPSVS